MARFTTPHFFQSADRIMPPLGQIEIKFSNLTTVKQYSIYLRNVICLPIVTHFSKCVFEIDFHQNLFPITDKTPRLRIFPNKIQE
jgi:hypothetical protein